jgi:hypothetical protein
MIMPAVRLTRAVALVSAFFDNARTAIITNAPKPTNGIASA